MLVARLPGCPVARLSGVSRLGSLNVSWAVDLHRGAVDDRGIGDLVSRRIEQADTIFLAGRPAGDDDWKAEQVGVLLPDRALGAAPSPGRFTPAGHGPVRARRTAHLRTARASGGRTRVPTYGVVACVFHARRPFIPEWLHEALDEITRRVLRSRGHFWLASRPDSVMTWESADGLTLGPVSGWLAGLPDEHWTGVDAERRHPRLGPLLRRPASSSGLHRASTWTRVHLHRTLVRCLLTDEELSQGGDLAAAY